MFKSYHLQWIADSGFEPQYLGHEPVMLPLHQSTFTNYKI